MEREILESTSGTLHESWRLAGEIVARNNYTRDLLSSSMRKSSVRISVYV